MPNATPSYRTTAPARSLILAAGVAAACWLGVSASAAAQAANSVGSRMNEQVVMIAGAGGSGELQTTIFKPDGKGPFPVLVMNHGKDMGDPRLQKRDRFLHLSREFVKRGYAVVLPMRKGFAGSSGTYRDYGCNMSNNGQLQANDLQQTIDYL
ncbi:MAG: CocE/NonD family hydrolase, partial [Lacisediminimonas sp.]|nr:CocE/NonD family hydrolase [Lacisediminimonas sp.]